jgi:hypothetical protein
MDALCVACTNGPKGMAGHDGLGVQTVGDRGSAFLCRRCRAFWFRSATRRGGLSWTHISERMAFDPALGTLVPPRTNSPMLQLLPHRADH